MNIVFMTRILFVDPYYQCANSMDSFSYMEEPFFSALEFSQPHRCLFWGVKLKNGHYPIDGNFNFSRLSQLYQQTFYSFVFVKLRVKILLVAGLDKKCRYFPNSQFLSQSIFFASVSRNSRITKTLVSFSQQQASSFFSPSFE